MCVAVGAVCCFVIGPPLGGCRTRGRQEFFIDMEAYQAAERFAPVDVCTAWRSAFRPCSSPSGYPRTPPALHERIPVDLSEWCLGVSLAISWRCFSALL